MIDLLLNLNQILRQISHGNGFQHIADNIVLDRLLGVGKIVETAQKRNLRGRADFPHLSGQLHAGNKRHPDIGKQQIRLLLADHLKGLHPVLRLAHYLKSYLLPVNPADNRSS